MTDPRSSSGQASVDFLVDESGSRVEVPDASVIRPAMDREASVGAPARPTGGGAA